MLLEVASDDEMTPLSSPLQSVRRSVQEDNSQEILCSRIMDEDASDASIDDLPPPCEDQIPQSLLDPGGPAKMPDCNEEEIEARMGMGMGMEKEEGGEGAGTVEDGEKGMDVGTETKDPKENAREENKAGTASEMGNRTAPRFFVMKSFSQYDIDVSMVKGRKMINLDSEDEGIFTVSCAGGARATLSLKVERKMVYGPCVRLSVDGLQGGHSGAEIHKNRANANKVMGEFMSRILKLMPLCLTSFSGGSKDNAIPRSCQANVVAMGIGLERINSVAEALQAEIREQYDEPEATVQAFDVDALGGNSLTTEDTSKAVALLCAVPNGVQSFSADIPGLVQTSLNLGIAKLGENFSVTFSVRSSVNQEKEALLDKLRELCAFYDGSYSQMGEYPAWEYRKDSSLRDLMVKHYTEMFGKEPQVLAIHAGLECGLLGEKLPGLDCVSIGPQMHDIHTSREKLEIASTQRVWEFLCAVPKEL